MKSYRLTVAADQQLRDIWRYSSGMWGDARADAYLRQIEEAIEKAIAAPVLLRSREDIWPGMVACRAASHMVYGEIQGKVLIVVGVLHGAMDPALHLHPDQTG